MTNDNSTLSTLQQLVEDDAVGQLRRRDGLMATLGSEDGALKLDWVEGIARLLADPAQLEEVEAEARDIWQRGIRHVIWAGMGGSVIAVRVFCDLGFCSGNDKGQVSIYPLDSTDPAALNAIIRKIAEAKKLARPSGEESSNPTFLRALFADVMMVGVAMGMTSEEPITHLEWFTDLLKQAGLRPAEHLLVMTLPGSYLDRFAHEQQAPSRPLQPDGGTGTGGRMSAPTTRVFLLPTALYLTTHFPGQSGQLRSVLQHAWNEYNLELATSHPAEHPFVQLAAALSAESRDGACRLLLRMPEGWQAFVSWLEQLMEESLGKGGKGVVVFDDQLLNHSAPGYQQDGILHVHVVTEATQSKEDQLFLLSQPSLASKEPHDRLAALAASFLGWQLSMALYGYLQRITFAGQPAVENYKARARALRTQLDPLQVASNWRPALQEGILILLAPHGTIDQDAQRQIVSQRGDSVASVFARALQESASTDDTHRYPQGVSPSYLDLTVNGEAQTSLLAVLDEHVHTIGNKLLGIPVKLRKAPADYHSTEQSEMDGPPSLVSLRLVARNSEACLLGSYTNTFLHAQAVSTWQAMMEAGRPCFLLVIDGSLDDAIEPLSTFFSQVEKYLHNARERTGRKHMTQKAPSANPHPEPPYILALDVGTSSTRTLLFDAAGNTIPNILAQRPYKLTISNEGEVSVDPDTLVSVVCQTIDDALAMAGPLVKHIGAVALDTFWHGLMGVDADNHPLIPLILWEDTRPHNAAVELRKQLDEAAIHARTGARLHASYWPAKLRWLATQEPDTFSHVAQWLSFGEYLYRHFLGRSVCSLSMASGTGMLHTRARAWDTELMKVLNVRPEQFPLLGDLHQSVQGLTPAYASTWPALRDVPWFPATGDGAAACVGSGCASMENWSLTMGTSSAMRVVVPPEQVIPPMGLWLYLIDAKRAVLGGALSEGGNLLTWLDSTLKLPSLADAESLVAALPPDGHGLTILPFLAGERSLGWHANARMTISGMQAHISPADILRAGMESLAYQLNEVYEQLCHTLQIGKTAPKIIGSGGALLGSMTLEHIVADTLGVPVYPSLDHEASARGAALLALEAMGILPDAAQVPPHLKPPVKPDAEKHVVYRKAAERQQKLYKALLEINSNSS